MDNNKINKESINMKTPHDKGVGLSDLLYGFIRLNDKNIIIRKSATGLEFETSAANEKPLKINDDNSIEMEENAWNKALILGTHHLWVDSTGDLRIKSSAPANDSDGTVVGTQS